MNLKGVLLFRYVFKWESFTSFILSMLRYQLPRKFYECYRLSWARGQSQRRQLTFAPWIIFLVRVQRRSNKSSFCPFKLMIGIIALSGKIKYRLVHCMAIIIYVMYRPNIHSKCLHDVSYKKKAWRIPKGIDQPRPFPFIVCLYLCLLSPRSISKCVYVARYLIKNEQTNKIPVYSLITISFFIQVWPTGCSAMVSLSASLLRIRT